MTINPTNLEMKLRAASQVVKKELQSLPSHNDAKSENEKRQVIAARRRVESRASALWNASQHIGNAQARLPKMVALRARMRALLPEWEAELVEARAAIDPYERNNTLQLRRVKDIEDSLVALCYYRCYDCGHLTKEPLLGESDDGRNMAALCNECESGNIQYPGLEDAAGLKMTPDLICQHFEWQNFRTLLYVEDYISEYREKIDEEVEGVRDLLEELHIEIDVDEELGLEDFENEKPEPTIIAKGGRKVPHKPPKQRTYIKMNKDGFAVSR